MRPSTPVESTLGLRQSREVQEDGSQSFRSDLAALEHRENPGGSFGRPKRRPNWLSVYSSQTRSVEKAVRFR